MPRAGDEGADVSHMAAMLSLDDRGVADAAGRGQGPNANDRSFVSMLMELLRAGSKLSKADGEDTVNVSPWAIRLDPV